MAIEALEIRMAKLEGGYEQINERLGGIEQRFTSEIASLRSEMGSLRSEMGSLRSETASLRTEMATREDVGSLRSETASLRTEMATREDVATLRSETASLRAEMRAGDAELRKQIGTQFYWLLTFILGSILVPILRDLAR